MGASASTISDRVKYYHLTKDKILPGLLQYFDFDKSCTTNKTISVEKLLNILQLRKDVFFMFNK